MNDQQLDNKIRNYSAMRRKLPNFGFLRVLSTRKHPKFGTFSQKAAQLPSNYYTQTNMSKQDDLNQKTLF